ncbi:ADP-ribosyltransferase [Legionella quateirensis]|uniref:ADP-ribosyltransferase exoenzyme n=1 Tax=Legionella quateirensis TaxID=45072 RepID=A0A378KWZ9_9GAMM|nr:ADP-ribosyltransferase [Legionella quateirensis]KTD50866.1 ADP-ribosyltransferase exoenzyme [Legionella quateirensis]STY17888.1 ADP-ribosyltransferase exoenzyme [Legionella quateirensis]
MVKPIQIDIKEDYTNKIFDEIQVPEKVVEERVKQLDKILNFFKVEAYAKYSDTKFKDSIDQFIMEAKKINKELSSRYKEDQEYKDQLEGRLCQFALESFPHQNTIIRLVLDLILWPLCFITKLVTGSWFFSTADTNRVKLFKTEQINVDEAVSQRNWKRFSQLLARKEPISKSIRETASKFILEDDRWDVGFQLEKGLSEGEYVLTQGPLMKSIQTKQLEELTHKLLTLTNFKMIHSDNSDVLRFDTGEEFNLTDIFKFADLSHLSLSASDYAQYEQLINPGFISWGKKLQSKFPDLTIAEMAAIHRYTGSGYIGMNSLLREKYPYSTASTSILRSVICHTVMCASGLSKTPDSNIPVCYRGEQLYDKEEHYKRIQAAAVHGVIQLSGFVSTSVQNSKAFSCNVQFSITNLKGKYIAELSAVPHEKEFLILPTHVQIGEYKYTDGYHSFKGALVRDLALIDRLDKGPQQVI